ncbi:MAG: acyl-CoA synthetase, partial [Acidimicrobiia bacterium]|nr:acyl-CoA synthetase [Acidimicrobiia bacterium]NDE81349.1 acyl-CoA synthetase [Actinomycetota bacterium]
MAHAVPEAPAQYGFAPDGSPLQFSWSRFDQRANGIARAFLDAGAAHQDKVAQYMYNCPQYLESIHACFKAGLAPVNTNYRY